MALAITNLTSGSDTTNNPCTTASISPTNGAVVIANVAFAIEGGNSLSSAPFITISGCGLTWEEISKAHPNSADRRSQFAWKGTGTPSTGSLTITANPLGEGTWTETMWIIDQVTGHDGTTPFGTPTPQFVTGVTENTITVSGTPDAGDFVYAAFRLENSSLSPTLNGELSNQLALLEGGTDVRALLTAYDSTPDSTPTPGITWTGTNGSTGIAFIVNVGGATQSNAPRAVMHLNKMMRV